MAEPTTEAVAPESDYQFQRVLPTPTHAESWKAAAQSNVLGSAILYGYDTVQEAIGDSTPIDDALIEKRLADENLAKYAESFVGVETQGQLDARVNRVRRQLDNKRITEANGFFSASNLVMGLADLPTLLPVGAAAYAVKAGYGLGKAAALEGANLAAQALAVEGGLALLNNETYEPNPVGTGLVLAGSAILGGAIGYGAARSISRDIANKLGNGVAHEAMAAASGANERAAKELTTDVMDRTAVAASGDVASVDNSARFTAASTPEPITFKTSKGSSYVVGDDGTTTRNKAARNDPGHEGDFGPKPASEATYYVDSANMGRLGIPQGEARVIDNGDGTLSIATKNEKGQWGVAPSQRNVPVTTEPAIGLHPVELWKSDTVNGRKAYKTVHFGNDIVEMSKGGPAKAEAGTSITLYRGEGPTDPLRAQNKKMEWYTTDYERAVSYAGDRPDRRGVFKVDVPAERVKDLRRGLYDNEMAVPRDLHETRVSVTEAPVLKPIEAKIAAVTGEEPTPSQIALASSLGVEAMTRTGAKLFGRSMPLEMISSSSNAAREFATVMFRLPGKLANGMVTPESFGALKGIIDGHLGTGRREVLKSWRAWSKEQGNRFPSLAALRDEEATLAHFSDLVYQAVMHGDKIDERVQSQALREAILDPHVQRAAAAYRKFDDAIFEREVTSGLSRRDSKRPDHVRHIYRDAEIINNREDFVKLEQGHAFAQESERVIREADEQLQNTLQRLYDKRQADEEKFRAAAGEKLDVEGAVAKKSDTLKELRDIEVQAAERDAHREAMKALDKLEEKFDKRRRQELSRAKKVANEQLTMFHGSRWRRTSSVPDQVARQMQYDDIVRKELEKTAGDFSAAYAEAEQAIHDNLKRTVTKERKAADARLKAALDDVYNDVMDAALELSEEKINARLARLDKLIDRAAEAATKRYNKAVSKPAMDELRAWSQSHAEGVWNAIVGGRQAVIDGTGSGGMITSGNVRGGRIGRNVFTPTHELHARGWLDTDIMKVMSKQAREDGMDSIMAKLFRREMSETERALAKRDSKEAYWLHGDDPNTVPDLAGVKPRKAIVAEFTKLIENAKTPEERQRLVKEQSRMLEYVSDSMAHARGIDDSSGAMRHMKSGLGLARAIAFSVNMGGSLITNTADAWRLMSYHGVGLPIQYATARIGEKIRKGEMFSWMRNADNDMHAMAEAAGMGLDDVNFTRIGGMADITDPYAASTRDSRVDRMSDAMTKLGGKMFGINWWNNLMRRAGYGMSQYKIGKLALRDFDSLSGSERAYLQYIGIDKATHGELGNALRAQGVKELGVGNVTVDHTAFPRELQDKFIAAVTRDVNTIIVTPDGLNLPRAMRNPVMKTLLQFQSFALAAAETQIRGGQRLQEGGAAAGQVVQTMIGMGLGALAVYMLQGAARSGYDLAAGNNQGKTEWDKRLRSITETPGQFAYRALDLAGVMPMFVMMAGLLERGTGFGPEALAKHLVDDGKQIRSNSNRRPKHVDGYERLAGVLGPTAGLTKNVLELASTASEQGLYAAGISRQRPTQKIDQGILQQIINVTPYAKTFYLRNILESPVSDAVGTALELRKPPNR